MNGLILKCLSRWQKLWPIGVLFFGLLPTAWSFPTFNTNLDPHLKTHQKNWSVQGGFLLPDATWRALSLAVNDAKVRTKSYYWQGRWEYFFTNDWAVRLGGEWQEIYNENLHFIGIFLAGDIVDVLYTKLRHHFYGVFSLGFAPYVEFLLRHNIKEPNEFNPKGTAYQGKLALEYEYHWRPSWLWRFTAGYFYEKPLGIAATPKVTFEDVTIQGPYAGINLVYRP